MSIKQVDISRKRPIRREAFAKGIIKLRPSTIKLIREGALEKGDALQLARVAGIMAAKMTPQLLPLCHPLRLEAVDITTQLGEDYVEVRSHVVATEKTGVEMEALMAVSTALLNIWDVVKQYEKDERGQYPSTSISEIRVELKVKYEDEGS
ncbi:MAG: cyclic pyranopterin monophosphate synthase MoaC [Aigarchaeota archaeon]|nr:cyclic pyranopterin monophosphate synthase MoaC [Candidatus Pelearchaeum maunauluense]